MDVEQNRDRLLKSKLWVTHPVNICTNGISLKSTDPGLAAGSIVHSPSSTRQAAEIAMYDTVAHYGRSFHFIQGHRNRYQTKVNTRVPIGLPM